MNKDNYSAASHSSPAAAVAIVQPPQLAQDAVAPWVRRSLLVLQGQAVRHAIEVHQWCESEKVGHDIGWEHAVTSWHAHFGHVLGGAPGVSGKIAD